MLRFLARLRDRWLGERIIIHGAGPNGTDLRTRIGARPDETTMVLANGATLTTPREPGVFDIRDFGAKCDGGTDDTAATQAAFAAARAWRKARD